MPNINAEKTEKVNFSQAKNAIFIQGDLRENFGYENLYGNIDARGTTPHEIVEMSEEAEERLSGTDDYEKNKKRIIELATNLGISETLLNEEFKRGLLTYLKVAYRLDYFDNDRTNKFIDEIIASYTIYFRRTLRGFDVKAKTEKPPTPNFILAMAKKGYVLEPRIYYELCREYRGDSEIQPWMIKDVLQDKSVRSTEVRAILGKIKSTITDLEKQYENDEFVDPSIIKQLVMRNFDKAEERLKALRETYFGLREKYRGNDIVTDTMIKRFVVSNSDPEKNIEDTINLYSKLMSDFEGDEVLTPSMIKTLVVRSTKDYESIKQEIYKIKALFIKLKDFYENKDEYDEFLRDWMIKRLVTENRRSFKSIKEKINRERKAYNDLKEEFQDDEFVEEHMIRQVIITGYANPRDVLIEMRDIFNRIMARFTDGTLADEYRMIVKYTIFKNFRNPEEAVNRAINRYESLKLKYGSNPDVRPWMIQAVALQNPSNVEAEFHRLRGQEISEFPVE